MAEFMQLTGFKELAAALRELPERVARNGLRAAVNAGAGVIKQEAIAKAPEATGALKANFYQKQIREQSGPMQQTFYVGVRKGVAKYASNKANKRSGKAGKAYKDDGTTFYWRFMEFGTSKIAPRPFLRPAFETKKEDAVNAIGAKLDERIQKYARELAKL
ncbi:HK97-gp10 family putative phage morphogenesis protein [Polaromonas sp. CG_23.6]|uniref:HK97-gp10 family putative phage morphogenesis protein n=1 Tax=Polaromonas sp. CG_23.6 TaxID=2760709 RepID=UPI002476EAC9|nr:HK97-gp10 family putative phage morphogenesis protein [Polaromonas sp. CG_23.6]MDH6185484.1 HK97 gp10 family phage protein [Polaromonas sp. CG_23.6]